MSLSTVTRRDDLTAQDEAKGRLIRYHVDLDSLPRLKFSTIRYERAVRGTLAPRVSPVPVSDLESSSNGILCPRLVEREDAQIHAFAATGDLKYDQHWLCLGTLYSW